MTELMRIIGGGESETLEFKESFAEERELFETICAFSNSRGGKILVGVDDKGRVRGVTLGKNTVQNFLNKVKSFIEPALIPQVEVTGVRGKTVVIIQVGEGINKPYFFKGVALKRVGNGNQRIPKEELEKLVLEKFKEAVPFEDRKIEATMQEIDEGLIADFSREASLARKVDLKFRDREEFLRKIGGFRGGKPTVCAILCLSENPQLHLPYAIVKCGTFIHGALGRERETGGDIRTQIRGALDFLRESLTVRFKIDESGKRVETWEIPLDALREAIVNAIAHRDYSVPSPVYVKVFEDRVEITNPGGLLAPLRPEELKKDHPSILRNPKLANFLFLSGFIEKWGRGTNKMVESCLRQGLREPEFVEDNGFFKVTIFREILNEFQRKMLELAGRRETPSADIAKKLKINERTARKHLSALCSMGLIRRRRVGRKIFYSTP